jgi:hypothetical protein
MSTHGCFAFFFPHIPFDATRRWSLGYSGPADDRYYYPEGGYYYEFVDDQE